MLFMIDEYISENPDRPLSALDKFRDCSKNLHELSLQEINEEVAKWNPLSKRTAYNQKKSIAHYFQWLQSKGVSVDIKLVDSIQIPISQNNYLIYSISDLEYYYNILFKILESNAINNAKTWNKPSYYMCYAADILAFYGLTEEQILKLKLNDVSETGIKGYNLPLTENNLKVLMFYKMSDKYTNGTSLIGDTYIRSTRKTDNTTDTGFLSRPIWRLPLSEQDSYLKKLLRTSNVLKLGVFDRIYQKEKETNELINIRKPRPQWLDDIIRIIVNPEIEPSMVLFKKDYINYRNERNNAKPKYECIESANEEKSINKNKAIERYNEVMKQMKDLSTELEQLKDLIK